jgi:uncharacterized protein (TIGR02246 family)
VLTGRFDSGKTDGLGEPSVATLEQRIQKLEDRAEIQDLVARYFKVTDDDDEQALAECFARDARFIATGFDGGTGRAGVMEFLRTARSTMQQTVHTPNYVHINFKSADNAEGTVMAHLEIGMGGTTVYAAVRYLDTYAREDGNWRIATREMRVVHLGSWDLVASSMTEANNVRWPGAEPAPSDFLRKTI